MKIALFQDVDSILGPRIGDESQEREHGYIRISGYVNVDFPPLEPEAVQRQLFLIDEAAAMQRELHEDALRRIEDRRSAVTAQSNE